MAIGETERLAKPRTDWSRYVTGGLVALLAGVLVYQGVGEARRSALVKTGEVAPPLVGRTLEGQPFDLGALKGKAVVVDFWATWCEACREEMPSLVALARDYKDKGVVLVMADQASSDQPAAVGVFAGRLLPDHPENVQVVLAAEEALEQYRVTVFPTTYFIGRDGKIVDSFHGLHGESALRNAVERALERGATQGKSPGAF